jgi:hypothetical protein
MSEIVQLVADRVSNGAQPGTKIPPRIVSM